MKFLQTAIFLFISFFSCAQNSTQQLHQNIAAVFKQQQGDRPPGSRSDLKNR